MPSPNKQNILFSDIFKVDAEVIEGYGAFNISLWEIYHFSLIPS